MYDETYEEMKENWKRILDLGPKPFGSEALSQCSHYLEQTLHEITGNACRDIYKRRAWSAGKWKLEITGHGEHILESYLFLGSGASAGFEGRLRYAGHNRVWDMYVWDRYSVVDENETILAYITVRGNGEAIPQMLFTGDSELPHFIVGADEADFFAQACEKGLRFRGFAESEWKENADCIDVVGTIGDGSRKVIVCGHYDTVYSTPGAYDNAAGAAVVLELARRLRNYDSEFAIQILLTDGEEFGLQGSKARCESGKDDDAVFVLNIDGVGRDNVLEVWSGPEPVERKIRQCLSNSPESFQAIYKCPPPPGSDHAPYFDKGIPVCMLTFNDQGILHSPKDIYEECKLDNMAVMVRLSLDLLERMNMIQKRG